MKGKSKHFAKLRGTHDRYRWMMFKFSFRKLRRSGKSWNEISDILAIYLDFGDDLRHDLLNHYFRGTKVPSTYQLIKILNALNQTNYTSPVVLKFINHLIQYQISIAEIFNKHEHDEFNRAMEKIESDRMKAIKKASRNLRAPLKTLIYYSHTTEDLKNFIEHMIQELHVELDSEGELL